MADGNSNIGFARLCFVRHKDGIYAICCLVPQGTHENPKIVCRLRTHPAECSKLGKTQIIADAKRGVVRNTGFCGQIYRRLLYLELTYEFPGYQIPVSVSVPLSCQFSVSVFHLPEGCGVRRERTATSKVVRLPGEQVNSCAAACVEMRREAFGIGVDGD